MLRALEVSWLYVTLIAIVFIIIIIIIIISDSHGLATKLRPSGHWVPTAFVTPHKQIKQRHWCKQRHVTCARMRCSSKQVFRLAECNVHWVTSQCSPRNIEILMFLFFKMSLHYLTVHKNIPAWKYIKKLLSILVCHQNIWLFDWFSSNVKTALSDCWQRFLTNIRSTMLEVPVRESCVLIDGRITDCHLMATAMKVSINIVCKNMEIENFWMELRYTVSKIM